MLIFGTKEISASRKKVDDGIPLALQRLLLCAFFLINFIFLTMFCDRNGYEGDDLNSIIPMFHLDAAKQGALAIYRYPWQPLSYELGAAIFRATGTPTAIFLLAPIAGAVSLTLLLSIIWHNRASTTEFIASLVTLLAIPEFWFSGLYYNSSVVGLPFALGSIIMLRSTPSVWRTLIAGFLISVAILMRMDFVLACPAMAVIAWQYDRSFARPIVLASCILSFLALASFIGLVDVKKIFEIYRESSAEITAKAYTPGWDLRKKLEVLSVMFSPIGWIILLSGGPLVIYQSLRHNFLASLLWVLAILPLALPLPNLLSIKYALPLLMFVPTFLMQCLSAIEMKMSAMLWPWVFRVFAVSTFSLLFVSISVMGKPPFFKIGTLASRPVGTHDGMRSYGGYLWQMATVYRLAPRSERQLAADRMLSEFLNPVGPDIVFVGKESFFFPGSIGWRHLQLELERSRHPWNPHSSPSNAIRLKRPPTDFFARSYSGCRKAIRTRTWR